MSNVIVNLRGTSGSGKSTLIKAIMAMCTDITPVKVEGRKQPLGYVMAYTAADGQRSLFIPGHYESACGGCDTVSKFMPGVLKTAPVVASGKEPNSYHLTFGLVREYFAAGYNVLFEGLLISGDVAHTTALFNEKLPVTVVAFDLPVELCISSVVARRAAKGNTEPFNEKNTREKHKLLGNCCKKLASKGVDVRKADSREGALDIVSTLLGVARASLVEAARAEEFTAV